MADAAPAGGGGWGALEIILAVVLGIGLIATLTGTPLPGSSNSASSTKKTTTAADTSNSYTIAGCTLVITDPLKNAQIDNTVIINGSITACLNQDALPTTLNAQVTDSTGTFLSILTPLDINKNIFGDVTFSAVVPLSGVAHSTKATVTISGPTAVVGTNVNIRIPINLTPVAATTTTTYSTPVPTPTTYTTPTVYTAPAQTTAPTTTTTNSNTF